MIIQRRQPAPAILRPVVRSFSERIMALGSVETRVRLPGRPDLFVEIYLGDPYRVADGAAPPARTPSDIMVVSPHIERRVTLCLTGFVHAFHISLQPTATHRLFGVPAPDLVDQAIEGRLLLGPGMAALRDGVLAAPDFEGRVAAAVRWFGSRLQAARAEDGVDFTARLVRRAHGRLPLAPLAARAGLGERQWRRRFEHQTGLAPKTYSRLARLNAAIELARLHPGLGGSELALRSGYFDHSHMLRDARAILGATPASWISGAGR